MTTYYEAHKKEINRRCKAYYEANKEALLAKRRKYRQDHAQEIKTKKAIKYQANKESIKAKIKLYRQDHPEAIRESKRTYYEHNLERITKHHAEYIAMKKKECTAIGDTLGVFEAAANLGISANAIRKLCREGYLGSQKIGNKLLLVRADIDAYKADVKIRAPKRVGSWLVPEGFDLITTYPELTEYTLAFAGKKWIFLLMVGSPGSGKSRQIKADLAGKQFAWIDNHVTNLGMYCKVYEAMGCPVVCDDVNHFLENKLSNSLIKALTQTEVERSVSWESPSNKVLQSKNIPFSYKTSSPICLIANDWDASNPDLKAIQDRAIAVAFFPSASTIHERVIELGWCPDVEIVDFIGENLTNIPQPSMREYYQAMRYKHAGMDWRVKLRSIWGLE